MRWPCPVVFLSAAALFPAGDRRIHAANPELVLTHATLVAGTDAPPQPDMTVVIANGRIRDVGPARKIRVPKGATVVDASGKFLIPGLVDMHVHTIWDRRIDTFFPLFVANGITGVRDMYGDLKVAEALREDTAASARLGPWFVTSGPIVDGPKPVWAGSRAVSTAPEGREAVVSVKRQGADFVKVYSLLPREAYFAIAEEARREAIPFAGHVPLSVSAAEASDAGQKSIEHLSGTLLACSDKEDALRTEALDASNKADDPAARRVDWLVDARAAESYDPEKARALFSRFVKNGTWHVPTLVVVRLPAFLRDPDFINDPRLKYMAPDTRSRWDTMRESRLQHPTAASPEEAKKLFARRLELVGALHRAGVRILAGSDTPNPYVFPGFSLHDELALLVKAGLTPLQALHAATRSAAEYLGRLHEMGTVEKGKRADLVLLDANPLDDIGNTKKIHAVVVGGRFVSKSEIESLLAKVEAASAQEAPAPSR